MKKIYISALLVIIAIEFTHAKDDVKHMISGGSDFDIVFNHNSDTDEYDPLISLDLSYGYRFSDDWVWINDFDLYDSENVTQYVITTGLQYNFGSEEDKLNDSFYTGLTFGYLSTKYNNVSDTDALVRGHFGKRFELTDTVSFSPMIEATHVFNGGNNNKPDFRIVPLQFTILF